jgi:hypothetical protein
MFQISRYTDNDMVLSGYHVPAGTHVDLNPSVHFRDQDTTTKYPRCIPILLSSTYITFYFTFCYIVLYIYKPKAELFFFILYFLKFYKFVCVCF